jgi:queuine tRNA-ribosyltransferase
LSFDFKIIKKSSKSRARLGLLKTSHGVVETPALVPVATQATVKALTSEEVLQTGSQILICNTFHLHLKPGEKIVKAGGQLHKFMNWPKPIMTDSAGYQVFSLGFGRDHGVGKLNLAKNIDSGPKADIEIGQQPMKVKITDEGVYFNSPVDGKRIFIGPKESIKIQEVLGADIIFTFDECTSPLASYEYTKKSLEKTHKWATQCLKFKSLKSKQALFGIVQGGKFKDLRIQSAKFIGGLPFDGFGIGGEFGDDKRIMTEMLDWVLAELPEEKPRHLLGIGHLEDIEKIIKAGVDTFDCIVPTHYARRGVAFTSYGKIDFKKSIFLKDRKPLDKNCKCFVCQNYTRSYIAHLFKAHEISPLQMLTFHNLCYFNSFVGSIREKIRKNQI